MSLSVLLHKKDAIFNIERAILKSFLLAQISILEVMALDTRPKAIQESIYRRFKSVLSESDYFQLYLETILSDTAKEPCFTFLHILFQKNSGAPAFKPQEIRSLIEIYTALVFETKATPTEKQLQFCELLLERMSQDDFDVIIEPILSKALKKSPDTMIAPVAHLVQHVQLDLGK